MDIHYDICVSGRANIGAWQSAIYDVTSIRVQCDLDADQDFRAQMRSRPLGASACAEMFTQLPHAVSVAPDLGAAREVLVLSPRSGRALLQIDGVHAALDQHDLVLIPAGGRFTISQEPATSLLVHKIAQQTLKQRIGYRGDFHKVSAGSSRGLTRLCGNFLADVLSLEDIAPNASGMIFERALDLLSMALGETGDGLAGSATHARTALLRRAKLLLESRLQEPNLTPSILAQELGVSESYLYALFRDEGTSPMRFVFSRRLERARNDLTLSQLPPGRISEIAFRWGFESIAHFSRHFRQHYGTTPSQFRRDAIGCDGERAS